MPPRAKASEDLPLALKKDRGRKVVLALGAFAAGILCTVGAMTLLHQEKSVVPSSPPLMMQRNSPQVAKAVPSHSDQETKAIAVLQNVLDRVEAGVNYRQYSQAVSDAYVAVKPYIANPGMASSLETHSLISNAAAQLVRASDTWNAKLFKHDGYNDVVYNVDSTAYRELIDGIGDKAISQYVKEDHNGYPYRANRVDLDGLIQERLANARRSLNKLASR